jgi:hypothetical protein
MQIPNNIQGIVRRSPRDRPRTLARRQGAEIAQITGTG